MKQASRHRQKAVAAASPGTERVSFRLNRKHFERALHLATVRGVSQSVIFQLAIDEYLNREEKRSEQNARTGNDV
jgi:predicted transcriptional regulator